MNLQHEISIRRKGENLILGIPIMGMMQEIIIRPAQVETVRQYITEHITQAKGEEECPASSNVVHG